MANATVKDMLQAGLHFGHQTRRWNPKMKRYIFGQRSGIYIIDLEKTAECIHVACDFVRDVAAKGGKMLFVGTKKQCSTIVKEIALENEQFYINKRWLGGTLTNFNTIRSRVEYMLQLKRLKEDGVKGHRPA